MTARAGHRVLVFAAILATPLATGADGLGRLFFSPAERAALDALRAAAAEPAAASAPPASATAVPPPTVAPPALPAITVNGVVARSAGPSTAWINGEESYGRRLEDLAGGTGAISLRRGGVAVAGPDGVVRLLRPGQVFDPNAGTVSERYGGGDE